MKNYSIGIADGARTEFHQTLGLTGAEVSFNSLPAGVSVPFVHSHKENEEIYIITEGKGTLTIDGEVVKIKKGNVIKISPSGKRQFAAADDEGISYVGINLDDFRIPDNEGNQTIDEPIFPDGENAYFVDLPVKAMVKNIQKNKIPASVSYTAGTFICNHVLYGTLYLINKKYKNKKSGFIHIPFLPEQVINKKNTPSMELNTIVKGLTAAIEAIVKNDKDIKETGGTIC